MDKCDAGWLQDMAVVMGIDVIPRKVVCTEMGCVREHGDGDRGQQ